MRAFAMEGKRRHLQNKPPEQIFFACNVVTCAALWQKLGIMTRSQAIKNPRTWSWDNLGIGIAGLCVAHCLATTVILAVAASASSVFGNPVIHEAGLFLALVFGSIALGKGVLEHGFMMPAAIGGLGIGIMAGALSVPHGSSEVVFTILGVGILALGHDLNRRAAR
jgi:hypothetical protein